MSRLGLESLINDLNPSVFWGEHARLVFRPLLSIASGVEICRRQFEVVYQVPPDGRGATLGEILIERIAADGVGVTADRDYRALQAGIAERRPELTQLRLRSGGDRRGVEFEVNLVEVDGRPRLRARHYITALGKRQ